MSSSVGAWTPQRLALFEQLVGDGMTFEKAGAEVGVSKNAAIGKAYRMGFDRRPDAVLNTTQKARARAGKRRPPLAQNRERPPPYVLRKVSVPLETINERLDKIGPFPPSGRCVFPLWKDGRPDYRFCGEKVEGDGPYCDAHRQLTHVKGSAGSADD